MKTSSLPAQTPKASFSLIAIAKTIWQHFIYVVSSHNELQVWQKTDRYGNTYWQAYDPVTGRSTSLGSEDEMRIWIEQRYYQSN